MMLDLELVDDWKNYLADKYTAEELCELLKLDVWDILEAFEERVLELRED